MILIEELLRAWIFVCNWDRDRDSGHSCLCPGNPSLHPEDLLLTTLLRILPLVTIFQGWSSGASWQAKRLRQWSWNQSEAPPSQPQLSLLYPVPPLRLTPDASLHPGMPWVPSPQPHSRVTPKLEGTERMSGPYLLVSPLTPTGHTLSLEFRGT